MIGIVDYGMGNLRSVQKAFERVGAEAVVVTDPENVASLDKLVLPGVGAFRDAIGQLERVGFVDPIKEFLGSSRPFLGICLGLQLLLTESYEDGCYRGLDVVPGKVVRFEVGPPLKVPHMGWNQLEVVATNPLLRDLPAAPSFYFVHSYFVMPDDSSIVSATTDYGAPFTSVIARDNLFACQFHPEKSQSNGLQLLRNFAAL